MISDKDMQPSIAEMEASIKTMTRTEPLVNTVFRQAYAQRLSNPKKYIMLAYLALKELQELRSKCVELQKMQPAPMIIVSKEEVPGSDNAQETVVFTKDDVGKKVVCDTAGEGTIRRFEEGSAFPVGVEFQSKQLLVWFFADGRCCICPTRENYRIGQVY